MNSTISNPNRRGLVADPPIARFLFNDTRSAPSGWPCGSGSALTGSTPASRKWSAPAGWTAAKVS
jgi:hypothetical protein